MSAPDLSQDHLEQFRDSGADKHLTLLLGAGASASSGLPDWNELAARLLHRSKVVQSIDAARRLVKMQDPLLVAEAARKAPGANWHRSIIAALYEGAKDPNPSSLHIAAAKYLLEGDCTDTTLITLNFDTLLEKAIDDGKEASIIKSDPDRNNSDNTPEVHHLHGIVDPETAKGVVLTLSDFNNLVGDANSWQLALLRRSINGGAIVIAGTSYRDPDLRLWLHAALADKPAGHVALVLLTRQGFNVSQEVFKEIEPALVKQWEAIGFKAVILEDHTDAAQIIRELRYLNRRNYLSPKERAATIWAAHEEKFKVLQQQYSDQLLQDSKVLESALDENELNVSLWLADAQGHLARWASQDRIYRSLSDLQMIDTGHDSRWVAGKALGSEDIVFQNLAAGRRRRWSSVLALPIRVSYAGLPEFATGVISVGLPNVSQEYEASSPEWIDRILTISNEWSSRLIADLSANH